MVLSQSRAADAIGFLDATAQHTVVKRMGYSRQAQLLGERRSAEGSEKRKGAARIRTGDKGFAILCLSHLATAPVAPQAERSQRGAAT